MTKQWDAIFIIDYDKFLKPGESPIDVYDKLKEITKPLNRYGVTLMGSQPRNKDSQLTTYK